MLVVQEESIVSTSCSGRRYCTDFMFTKKILNVLVVYV